MDRTSTLVFDPVFVYRFSMSLSATAAKSLLRTPFHQFHVDHGAKMVEFAGWEMPIHYGSIIEEHRQVRRSGGIFDVSHMGRLRFSGRDARAFLDRVCTRQVWGMQDGQVRYSLVCNERGGCRDDVLVYRIDENEYYLVCNAANRRKLLDHFDAVRGTMKFRFRDETESTAMIAIQGPRVIDLLSQFSREIGELRRYRFTERNFFIANVMISRTGYTGEDGVEAILPAKLARKAVEAMIEKADSEAIRPAGLGARDSLRLEAGMPLYGQEITEDLDPISAGLTFAVKIDKGENPENSPEVVGRFIGQDALQQIARNGPERKLMGFILEGRRAARQGMTIHHDDKEVGFITSGCWSPTLEKSIAMGYIPTPHAEPGRTVTIDPGKLSATATVCALPFYKSK